MPRRYEGRSRTREYTAVCDDCGEKWDCWAYQEMDTGCWIADPDECPNEDCRSRNITLEPA